MPLLPLIASGTKPMSDMFSHGSLACNTGNMLPAPCDYGVMMAVMISSRQHFKVFWAIVQRVAIFVVNMLFAEKSSPDLPRSNNSVFIFPLTTRTSLDLPIYEIVSGFMKLAISYFARIFPSFGHGAQSFGIIRSSMPGNEFRISFDVPGARAGFDHGWGHLVAAAASAEAEYCSSSASHNRNIAQLSLGG